MKKYLLIIILAVLSTAVIAATMSVGKSNKTAKKSTHCLMKKTECSKKNVACY